MGHAGRVTGSLPRKYLDRETKQSNYKNKLLGSIISEFIGGNNR